MEAENSYQALVTANRRSFI